jgi:hypothetical protein
MTTWLLVARIVPMRERHTRVETTRADLGGHAPGLNGCRSKFLVPRVGDNAGYRGTRCIGSAGSPHRPDAGPLPLYQQFCRGAPRRERKGLLWRRETLHPATLALAGSNLGGARGETLGTEAPGEKVRLADQRASPAVICVNTEQASKIVMWVPTRSRHGEG